MSNVQAVGLLSQIAARAHQSRRLIVSGEINQQKQEPGLRYDAGKWRIDLIPIWPLRILAAVYAFGAKKYSDWNWAQGMSWSRCYGCMMRHATAWYEGEDNDHESGLNHLGHVAWNAFALLFYTKFRPEFDDRPKFTDKTSGTEL
jgi:hypothetical protein